MIFMAWNDRLSVGVDKIDDDHKELIRLINKLYEGIQEGHGKETLEEIFGSLVNYTHYHFSREEALYAAADQSLSREHKRLHDDFVEGVLKAQEDFKLGTTASPSLEMMVILKDWLFDHILGSDQRDFRILRRIRKG